MIISASAIPGNEKLISRVINQLFKKGANVIYEALADIHVSGHACQEEIKLLHTLIKPKFFIPVHGEYRHLVQHAKLAETLGMPPQNIFIVDNGTVLEFTKKFWKNCRNSNSRESVSRWLGCWRRRKYCFKR